ncbi:LPS export ABC transporter permease LptG [Bacteroidota bacterium]
MKILDKYLIKQFVQTIIFGLVAFLLLFIVIDMMENLDDFIDQDVPNNLIWEYYLVFIPEIVRLMLPVAVLLASLFTIGKMSNLSELTAIRAGGVSFYRLMVPFLVVALLISLFAIYFGGYIAPMANKHKVYIEQNYMKKGLVPAGTNIFFQDTKTRIVNIFYFDTYNNQANKVSIQEFDSTDITRMLSRIDAARMRHDSTKSAWTLFDGVKRQFTDEGEIAVHFKTLEIDNLNFSPDDVIKKQRKPEEMSLGELNNYAKEQLRTGNNPTRIFIEYHSRIAFSFTSLVVVLFGLPISANKRKGGLAIQFGISLLITFVYLVFLKMFQAFGKNGVLDPILTAWIANIIFLVAAVINIIRIQSK